MSVSINDKGGAEHRINLVKRGIGVFQSNMLKTVLVKKAENYHLQCDRFLTNDLPPISQTEKVLISIKPKGVALANVAGFNPANFSEAELLHRSTFKISGFDKKSGHKIYSSAGLVHEVCRFFEDFNFELFMQGANFAGVATDDGAQPPALINEENWVPRHLEYNNLHSPGNEIDPTTIQDYISAGVDSSGRLQLNITSQFWSNFYIEFDEVFAQQIGFPPFLYAATIGGGAQFSNQTNAAGEFNMAALIGPPPQTYQLAPEVGVNRNVKSTRSLFEYDDRLSFDLEVSLPLGMSIDLVNGEETHNFILSRFQITDYKEVTNRTKTKNGYLLSEGIFEDRLVGKIDLVRGEPNSHVSQLLNGKIQAFNIRIILRYKEYSVVNGELKFTIKRRPVEMDPYGFYDILVQFNKRVT